LGVMTLALTVSTDEMRSCHLSNLGGSSFWCYE